MIEYCEFFQHQQSCHIHILLVTYPRTDCYVSWEHLPRPGIRTPAIITVRRNMHTLPPPIKKG